MKTLYTERHGVITAVLSLEISNSAYLWLHQSMSRDSEFLDFLEDIHHIVNIQFLYDVKESTEWSTSALTVTVKQEIIKSFWVVVNTVNVLGFVLCQTQTILPSYHVLTATLRDVSSLLIFIFGSWLKYVENNWKIIKLLSQTAKRKLCPFHPKQWASLKLQHLFFWVLLDWVFIEN